MTALEKQIVLHGVTGQPMNELELGQILTAVDVLEDLPHQKPSSIAAIKAKLSIYLRDRVGPDMGQ